MKNALRGAAATYMLMTTLARYVRNSDHKIIWEARRKSLATLDHKILVGWYQAIQEEINRRGKS
jgi:hypothetical protein